MSIQLCRNCGRCTGRIRTTYHEDSSSSDICTHCSPSSFEKFTAPSDKKPWMGWEAHPNEYEKRYDKDGLIYDRKPEYRNEQEQRMIQATEEERQKQAEAVARKRAERRTRPMDSVELAAAMRKAEEIAAWVVDSAAQGRDVN